MLTVALVAPVRIPVESQSMIEVAYVQLMNGNSRETGIGFAYSLRISVVSKKIIDDAFPADIQSICEDHRNRGKWLILLFRFRSHTVCFKGEKCIKVWR